MKVLRQLLVLAAALGTMVGVTYLQFEQAEGVTDPLTLAAIGFVVLAAYTIGELGGLLGLPKVTGYIVAGVVLGPQVSDLLSDRVVDELGMFNTLALGLIATTAGLELDLGSIRKVWRTLVATVVAKIPLLLALVGGTFLAMETFRPSLGLPEEALIPVAIILGVLGIGTSPAIALAVVNESRAKGRLTDLLLAIAVVKDLVVVVSLAIALSVAKAMLDPHGHLDVHVLQHVAEEIGYSIAVGAVLGVLMIGYVRFVGTQMLLFLLLTILVAAELSHELHLELLLVFIVAGFLIRNFSPYEHDVLEPLEQIALPVFVVFFTTAGAGVDLRGTVEILPLTLALVAARTVAYFVASDVGARLGGEADALRKNAWLTYIPQAGVTLGLVFLAAEKLHELEGPLTSIGMALVAIHLLVGPVTMGIGLKRAGESGQRAAEPDAHGHGHDAHDDDHSQDEATEVVVIEAPEPFVATPSHELVASLGDAAAPAQHAIDTIRADADAFVAQVIERAEGAREALSSEVLTMDELLAVRERGTRNDWEDALLETFSRLAAPLQDLPRTVGRLPLQMAGRTALEGRLAVQLASIAASWHATRSDLLRLLLPVVRDGIDLEEVRPRARQLTSTWEAQVAHDLSKTIEEGALEMVALTRGRPRYSKVDATVRAALADLKAGTARNAAQQTSDRLVLAALVASAEQDVVGAIKKRIEALQSAETQLLPAFDEAIAALAVIHEEVVDGGHDTEVWTQRIRSAYSRQARIAVRRSRSRFARATQPGKLLAQLRERVDKLPAELPHDRLEAVLIDDFLADLARSLDDATRRITAADSVLNEGLEVAIYGLRHVAADAESDVLDAPVLRASSRLSRFRQELAETLSKARESLREDQQRCHARLARLLKSGAGAALALRRARVQARGLGDAARALAGRARATATYVAQHPTLRDAAVRSGHEELDAVGMQRWLDEQTIASAALPPTVASLFGPRPLDDRRLLVAHSAPARDLCNRVGTSEPVKALVVGRRGSGRTSLLNLAELEGTGRIVRPGAVLPDREEGLIGALADELSCANDADEVQGALDDVPTLVLVDNLERHLLPTRRSLEDLRRFVDIVVATPSHVRWVVSIETTMLRTLEHLLPLRHRFSETVNLHRQDWRSLRDVMNARTTLAGVEVQYPGAGMGRVELLLRGGAEEAYFRRLAWASRGDLGAALRLHYRGLRPNSSDELRATPPAPITVPFLNQLTPRALAVLGVLARYGPMSRRDLATALCTTPEAVEAETAFLQVAGLLTSALSGSSALSLPPELDIAVAIELEELGVLRGVA